MITSSVQVNEASRIVALYQLQILDTDAEKDYDDVAVLAAQVCETPVCLISFEDQSRSWIKAQTGYAISEIPIHNAFWVVNQAQEITVVENTLGDELLAGNPLIAGTGGFRFFASLPILNDAGLVLGHLCVMDYVPRKLTDKQAGALKMLARQVANLLRLRLKLNSESNVDGVISNEEQMNTIFHHAIDGVIIIDTKGVVLQWNPMAETIFGRSAAKAVGKYFYDIALPERHRKELSEGIVQYNASTAHPIFNKTIEITAINKKNKEFDIALNISPILIKSKRFFICFVRDITDRKMVADKLDKQKEFYENILNSLPTDIAVFDPDHRYLFVNPGAIKDPELRKYIIGKDDFEYSAYRKRDDSLAKLRREMFLEIKKTGKEIKWEDSLKDPEGNTITHLRRVFPVHGEDGQLTMVIGFGVDITDRKIMEEKQAALFNQLSIQNTQLIDFCNIVSHNLRGPLVNMSMLVKFIEESEDEEERKLMIAKLNPVIENLHNTFNELVESIQIKQDLEIKSEKIVFGDCLKRTLEDFELDINKSQALIIPDFDDAPVIKYPSKYIYSIFHNLISNALKYKSPKRNPEIKIKTRKTADGILLSVSDNGLGIDMTKHKDNFFKIGKVFHRHPDSKGFGLFMTKTQVEAMDGKIWVESIPDIGSTFFIEFKNQHV